MTTTSGRKNAHDYKAHLVWDGNLGTGTTSYTGYGRKYRLQIDGKPELVGSADPMFRGDGNVYNPEDLFVAALSSCHLLSYLALCARTQINLVRASDLVWRTPGFTLQILGVAQILVGLCLIIGIASEPPCLSPPSGCCS